MNITLSYMSTELWQNLNSIDCYQLSILNAVPWKIYEALLANLGDSSVVRGVYNQ